MSQVIAILLGAASPTVLCPGHHPAGRILAGKTGVGAAEEGAGAAQRPGRGRSRRERGSGPGNTVHATGSQRVSAAAES